ncbi:MAG TPA: type I polyketide synthase, partial [Rhodanobacter sp.]
MSSAVNDTFDGVAIVGMAGRFPGADSIDQLWANLLAGRESITRFAPAQLSSRVPPELARHPRYVPARGVIADADRFDAAFFGIAPREALLMDPQQRVLLEISWNALEHAGVDPQRFPGSIGVYAGTSNNTYRKLVESRADLVQAAGEFATMLANEKDYVATRIAHRLDLTGPALSIHTACSTSLVAIAQAWYALMSWQCDLALAGGINIVVPQESGHLPVEGGIESADGHCRPFDAQASGTLFSSGGAVVVLKRLAEAVEQGDTIWAVIRGVAVNNDGGDKASFGAPSVRGQAAVIRQALATAGVDAGSIGYVEAHGTGTPLGDPIEVEALTRAFRAETAANQFCWLGSVKSNFGHLVAASGVTGLIKAALALKHGVIPPTLHFDTANPQIDFVQTPFRVADRAVAWAQGDTPRRAGVSSFGVGGTNAHAVLEQAPPMPAPATGRASTLLLLSARDAKSLQRRADDLAAACAEHGDDELADIGYTLATGRQPMAMRGCVVTQSIQQLPELLPRLRVHECREKPAIVFLFPGQGSQHVNMARELVASEPVFRDCFEHCCALASSRLGCDLRALILPAPAEVTAADAMLGETWCTQPALFVIEYALAELWASWGIEPSAMIGHSIGEYVAACRAGVFSLQDAITLVVARGAAMHAQPAGAMLAVRLDEAGVRQRLVAGVEIAAINAPAMTVVTGAIAAIEAFASTLAAADIAATRLRVSHAFHSCLMDAALPRFRAAFDAVPLHAPQQVFYSCVSGAPITAAEATSPDYWCRQLRQPVRFAEALRHAASQGVTLYLEVGPAQALTGLARAQAGERTRAVASLGPAGKPGDALA